MARDYSDRAVEAVMPVFGDSSERVKELQTTLIARGFKEVGKADGIYGEATRKAISNFQNSIDLEVTGLAEPETFIELYKTPVKAKDTAAEASLTPQSTTQTTLRKVEAGGYDTLFGNFEKSSTPFKGVSVSSMTVGELADFSRASGAYGQYVKPRLGKNTYAGRKDTVFNKETQDKMFLFLARENIAKAKNPQGKRKNLRSIWEGFKHVDNSTLDKIIKEIDTNG